MKCVQVCLTFAALFVTPCAFAASPTPDSPLGCPPSRTLTAPPSGEAELVLADGPELTSERIAGPFDSPRSLEFLPDGSYLVAERQGRLLHVGAAGETSAIDGLPEMAVIGHGGLIDVAIDRGYPVNGMIYFSYLTGTEE